MEPQNMAIKAKYGTFDIHMQPIVTIDVSNIIESNFLNSDGEIIIPAGTKFNDYFTDPMFGKRKFLQIIINEKKHNIIEDSYSFDIQINSKQKHNDLFLIYYIYITDASNWRGIVSGQLLQLKGLGILDESKFFIHVTDTTNQNEKVEKFIRELVEQVTISFSEVNQFEYPALNLLYELALQNPDAIMAYLHTKGMSSNTHSRSVFEIMLLTHTFGNWRKNLQAFNDPEITKIGMFPAIGDNKDKPLKGVRGGWIWFNFWYARANYIKDCARPVVTTDRYFFEHWLGLQNDRLIINNDCYCINENRKNFYYTPHEAGIGIDKIVRRDIIQY